VILTSCPFADTHVTTQKKNANSRVFFITTRFGYFTIF
jgi:hypothetical protein